jgi:uncharacterized protein (DUF4415 family)
MKPDDDLPEITDHMLARAELRIGERVIRRGRPPLESPKQAIKLRIDADVVEHFRETGPGWQTRINEALRRALNVGLSLHAPRERLMAHRKTTIEEQMGLQTKQLKRRRVTDVDWTQARFTRPPHKLAAKKHKVELSLKEKSVVHALAKKRTAKKAAAKRPAPAKSRA